MDFFGSINSIIAFFQNNLFIAIAAAILLVFLLYRKPKLFLTIFFIALLLSGVFYLISTLSSTGVSHKGKILQKGDVP
jgi:hypothetical protein